MSAAEPMASVRLVRIQEEIMALGENLIAKGLLTQAQLETALAKQKESPGVRIGELLVSLGYVTKEQVESSL